MWTDKTSSYNKAFFLELSILVQILNASEENIEVY